MTLSFAVFVGFKSLCIWLRYFPCTREYFVMDGHLGISMSTS